MSWSRDQISVLINRYQEHPVLYDTKHMLYHNKGVRSDALQQMMNDICKIRPNTTVEMIKSKLNSLKTQFLPLEKHSTVEEENLPSWMDLTDAVEFLYGNSEEEELFSPSPSVTSDSSNTSRKRKANEMDEDELIADIRSALTQSQQTEDKWDVFGKFVASELKCLTNESRRKRMKIDLIQVMLKYMQEEIDILE